MIFVCRMFETAYIATRHGVQSPTVYKSVRGQAKRVLVVGVPPGDFAMAPSAMLAPDGMLIVMEPDSARAAEARARLSSEGLGNRATVIGGDPARMVYKLAGPFDLIVCSAALTSLRPMLEKLLSPDGVLITHVEPQH
jgi:predicted O-methyltransferase YrrM